MNGLVCLLLMSLLGLGQSDYVEIAILEQNYSHLNHNTSEFVQGLYKKYDTINEFALRFCFYWENETWHSAYEKVDPKYNSGEEYDSTDKYMIPPRDSFDMFYGRQFLEGYIKPLTDSFNIFYGKQFLARLLLGDTIQGPIHIVNTCFSIKNRDVPRIPDYHGQFHNRTVNPKYRPLVGLSIGLPSCSENFAYFKFSYDNVNFGLASEIEEFLQDTFISKDSQFLQVKIVDVKPRNIWFNRDDSVMVSQCRFELEKKGKKSGFRGLHEFNKNFGTSLDFSNFDHGLAAFDVFVMWNKGILKYYYISGELIDFGDYNNDGKLEWIFKTIDFDHEGYILFYNNFQNYVELDWHYH